MSIDHRAAFTCEATRLKGYQRQLACATPTDNPEDDPTIDLEVCINATLAIIDEHLDAWLTEQASTAAGVDANGQSNHSVNSA